MAKKALLLVLILCGVCATLLAQDTLSSSDVEVYDSYNPILSDAVKEPTTPKAEAPQAPLPKLEYVITPYRFATTSRLELPKALAMGDTAKKPLKNNLIRLGFGNYLSPMAELYLANTRSVYSSYGLTMKYLSADGPKNANFSDFNTLLFGKRFFKKGTLAGEAFYKRNAVRFYSVDNINDSIAPDSLKQVFNTAGAGGYYETVAKGKNKTQFRIGLNYYNISDKWGAKENDITAYSFFKTNIKKNELNVNLSYNYTNYQDTAINQNRNFVNIIPRYNFKGDLWKVSAGFNSTLYLDSNGTKFYFFPAIDGSYDIEKDNFSAIAGIGGNLQKNSYRQFATENPFVANNLHLNNTVNRFEFYLGLKGKASNNFSFMLRGFYNRYNDLAVFISDSTVFHRFKPIYLDARVLRFNAEASYQFSEKIRINFTGNFYNYKMLEDTVQQAWQLPTAEMKFNLLYNIGNKLYLSADIFFMNRRYVKTENTLATNTQIKGFADFNFGAEYRYRKNLSFFLKANNVSGARYMRWYNYPVLSVNVLGGLTFSL